MTGQEFQTVAALFSILKTLAGNDFFLVSACITVASIVIVPSIFAFKSVKALSIQIAPLRDEIKDGRVIFTKLIGEIREQRKENIELVQRQSEVTSHVMELIERVSTRLKKIEISSESK